MWGWKEQRRHFRTRCSFKGRGSFILWITGFFVIEIFLFSNLKILESNFELLAFEQRHFPRKAPSLILGRVERVSRSGCRGKGQHDETSFPKKKEGVAKDVDRCPSPRTLPTSVRPGELSRRRSQPSLARPPHQTNERRTGLLLLDDGFSTGSEA